MAYTRTASELAIVPSPAFYLSCQPVDEIAFHDNIIQPFFVRVRTVYDCLLTTINLCGRMFVDGKKISVYGRKTDRYQGRSELTEDVIVTTSFSLPASMLETLRARAKAEDRSVSSLLRVLIESPLDMWEKQQAWQKAAASRPAPRPAGSSRARGAS